MNRIQRIYKSFSKIERNLCCKKEIKYLHNYLKMMNLFALVLTCFRLLIWLQQWHILACHNLALIWWEVKPSRLLNIFFTKVFSMSLIMPLEGLFLKLICFNSRLNNKVSIIWKITKIYPSRFLKWKFVLLIIFIF